MGLTASQLQRNKDLITQAFFRAEYKCHFCKKTVDADSRATVWHHHTFPKKRDIARMKKTKTPLVLEAELQKCAPAHEKCHNQHHTLTMKKPALHLIP